MDSRNEEVQIYGKRFLDWSAWAWRRPPECSDWQVYVKFGDDGYECDPGIYGEPLDYAVHEVRTALSKLEALYDSLKAFQQQENVK